ARDLEKLWNGRPSGSGAEPNKAPVSESNIVSLAPSPISNTTPLATVTVALDSPVSLSCHKKAPLVESKAHRPNAGSCELTKTLPSAIVGMVRFTPAMRCVQRRLPLEARNAYRETPPT